MCVFESKHRYIRRMRRMWRLHTKLSVKVPALVFCQQTMNSWLVTQDRKGTKVKWKTNRKQTQNVRTHMHVQSHKHTHTYKTGLSYQTTMATSSKLCPLCRLFAFACLLWIFIYALVLQAPQNQQQHIHNHQNRWDMQIVRMVTIITTTTTTTTSSSRNSSRRSNNKQ